ncbi:MAG: M1 family metallopeptidase, partial [Acidilobus sp.]
AEGLKVTSVRANGREVEFRQDEGGVTVRTGRLSGVLEVEFDGEAAERLVGIYRARNGGDYYISTQFESVHARKMFPCVDNPAYKARFKLSVRVPKDLHAISNMPIERVTIGGDRKVVEFAETPPMSTYLLYLGIGRWDELVDPRGRYIVAAPHGKASFGRHALWAARRSVEFYERYFGIPYPLPKMHLIAVPEFAFGAMENWGAITFREYALLAPEDADLATRRSIANVVAHEIAHQWFGDLVTMKWWDDLWLNESFATFMSYKAVDSFAPEMRMWESFLMGETDGAMLRDSLSTTHPVHVEVTSPSEIEAIFDEISYGKGASVLRMVEYFLGESFRKGLSSYLEHYSYSNATADDLWRSIAPFTNVPVVDLMQSWVMKTGYPYLEVWAEGGRVHLRQRRFSLSGSLPDETYLVPVTMAVNGRRVDAFMRGREEVVDVGEEVRSLKVNLDRAGFYRVLYRDLGTLDRSLNPLELYGLLNDYYNFALAGVVGKGDYLSVVDKVSPSRDYLPVYELSNELFQLYLIDPARFSQGALEVHRNKVRELSELREPTMRELLGRLAFRLAVMDKGYADELSRMFGKDVEPDMRQAVYAAYAIITADLEGLRREYERQALDSERVKVITAVTQIRDRSRLTEALDWILTTKRQNYIFAFRASSNPEGVGVLWEWMKAGNLERVWRAFEGTAIVPRDLAYVIPLIGLGREAEVREFFGSPPYSNEVGIRTGLELLGVYSRFRKSQ